MANIHRKTKGSGVQKIDYKEAEQMLRSGATLTQVANRFGATPAAVSLNITRGNIKFETGRRRMLPWHMKPEHRNMSIPRSLRLAERIQRGEADDMPAYLRSTGEGFIRKLEELDAVIHYDPDCEPYFFRVPRRHGIDRGLIREPDPEE